MWAAKAYASAKYAPPAAATAALEWTVGGVDLVLAGAIVVGLVAGAVLRSSHQVQQSASRGEIFRDLTVSAMSGLANFILAAITVAAGTLAIPNLPELAASGVGLFYGYKGPDGIRWFNEKYFNDRPKSEPRWAERPPSAPQDMDETARKLDEDKR